MIEFNHVSKQYGENAGLHDVNITIEEGEFVFLVGPSGAGKSTLIKLLLKEKEPDEGSIFFDGEEVTDMPNRLVPLYRRKIGIVFQDFRLLRKKTVYENVAFAMEAVHRRKKLIDRQVPHLLKLVGISEKADRYPDELSGGEAQRVAIARAMVNNPKALIADEPTGNLDPEKAWEIMNLLNQINIRGTTILMVTHAKDIVDRMGKRVVQLEGGRVVRDDRTGLYIENPLAVSEDSSAEPEARYTPERERTARQKSSGGRIPAAAVMEKKPRPGKNTGKKESIRNSEPVSEKPQDMTHDPAARQSAATGQSPTTRRPSRTGGSRRANGASGTQKTGRPEVDTWVEIMEDPVAEYTEYYEYESYDSGETEAPVTRTASRRASGGSDRPRRAVGTATATNRRTGHPETDTWVEIMEEPVTEYTEYYEYESYDSGETEAPATRTASRRASGGDGRPRRAAGTATAANRRTIRPGTDTRVEIVEEPVTEYTEYYEYESYDSGETEAPATRTASRRASGGNDRPRRAAGKATATNRRAARPEADVRTEDPGTLAAESYDSAGEETPYTREERYRRNVQKRMRSRQVQREEKRQRVNDMFSQADEMNYWDGGDMFD